MEESNEKGMNDFTEKLKNHQLSVEMITMARTLKRFEISNNPNQIIAFDDAEVNNFVGMLKELRVVVAKDLDEGGAKRIKMSKLFKSMEEEVAKLKAEGKSVISKERDLDELRKLREDQIDRIMRDYIDNSIADIRSGK
jgi:hypothetical protein